MSVFYVSRDGVSADGEPVGRGRLLDMLRSGELGTAALVMAPGADEWFPARMLLDEAEEAAKPKRPVAERVEWRPMKAVAWAVGIVGLLVFLLVAWWLGLLLLLGGALMERPSWRCGACGKATTKHEAGCSGCGAVFAVPKKKARG